MKYEEALRFLNEIPMFSDRGVAAANFDLSRMHRFCAKIGNPHLDFPSILVAGTNGKGTVCRMLASVFSRAGYKTGLYTSPHLQDVRERFHLNGNRISKKRFSAFFNLYQDYIRDQRLTYFEVTTAIAFWWLASEKAEIAVIEVGLGGRLDATNVLNPLVSVITSVGMDHMNILGNTRSQIAFEKAGIIKPNGKVVTGLMTADAESSIRKVASEKSAEIKVLRKTDEEFTQYRTDSRGLVKKTDLINSAIVKNVLDEVSGIFPVTEEEFEAGISAWRDHFPAHGSFEKLHRDRMWFFDGAHNLDSTRELVRHLKNIENPEKWHVFLSFMADKLTEEVAKAWADFPNVYLYQTVRERAASMDMMNRYFETAVLLDRNETAVRILSGIESELVIFSGSFYFYSVVKNWMGTLASADQFNPPTLRK